jgi:acetolactate synthase I/II/III large subunit
MEQSAALSQEAKKISVSGAEFIASYISSWGIDHVFFVDAILRETLVELEKRGVKRILAHSENAAAYMADGYARASGKPGVCMAQSVGAANLASGLQDAYLNRTPVIAITGRKNPIYQHRNAYQELPHAPMYAAVTKFHADVGSVEQVPYLLPQAFREAVSGARRPTHLDVDGYRGAELEAARLTFTEVVYRQFLDQRPAAAPQAAHEEIVAAAALIAAAQRPMLVLGVGAAEPGIGDAVRTFVDTLSIPVATSIGGRGLIETSHPKHLGVLGTYSAPYANAVLYEADLVIYAGSHMGDQITCDWSNPRLGARIIQIDVDQAELGRNYPNTVGLAGSPRQVLRQLTAAAGALPERTAWLARCAGALRHWRERVASLTASPAAPIRAERLASELSVCLPRDAILVADTGFSATWTAQFTELNFSGQAYLRAAGSLGWGFPAAIGAKLAAPHRPVVCFTGDGALYYHLSELETVRRWNVPLVVVVNNNSALGQGLRSVKKLYAGRDGRAADLALFGDVDFARIAEDFGVRGARVERPDGIIPTISTAVASGDPALIDVVTDPDCNPEPPWLPAA